MYIRVCKTLSDIGTLVPATDLYKYVTDRNVDYYSSIFSYNEDQKKLSEQVIESDGKKRKRGISGITDVVTNKLVWDFDSSDLNKSKSDVISLCNKLEKLGVDPIDLNISFSGMKGFAVELNTDSKFNPEQFKNIVVNLAENLETFDSKITNPSRIFRVPYTKHQESGLYKTPLSYKELSNLTVEEIKQRASNKQEVDELFYYHSIKLPETFKNLTKVKPATTPTVKTNVLNEEELDYTKKPKWLSHWKYALLNGYFPNGSRSYALMVLASTYKSQGLPETVAYHALKGAAELQAERFGADKFSKDEIYNNIIKQVYGPLWNGGTYAEDNFPKELIKFFEERGIPRKDEVNDEDLIEKVDSGFGAFAKYAEEIDKHTMKFGIAEIDNKLNIRKGHLIGIIGSPGSGKTACAITILNNMSIQGTYSYFSSLDMYKNNVYQRLIQRHTGINENDLFLAFKNKDIAKINQWRDTLLNNYKNVIFCFKSTQSIPHLKESIKKQEQTTGVTIDLVVVDYLELIDTDKSDPTAASSEAIQGLREIANEGRVVVVLLQPNKLSSRPNEPLTSYNAAKGSSSIAQACTAILTVHRPGLSSTNPELDRYFSINCVKNRNGALFALDFGWTGHTQTLYTLSDIEKQELVEIRKMNSLDKTQDF